MLSAAVMLPTYNEVDNLRRVVELILSQPADVRVVVVDDQSPDGTGQLADELAQEHPGRVFVLHRTGPRGRGVAGVDGFKYCLSLPVDCIMEMDADLSHDPDDIPRFVAAAEGADLVMGSRYVKGGKEANRLLYRRVISRLANTYLRLTLGVSVHDCSSGYRLFRRELMASLDLDGIASHGPSILTEILWQCKLRGCRIREIPITFREREVGTSKLNGQILLHSLLLPLKLRLGSGGQGRSRDWGR